MWTTPEHGYTINSTGVPLAQVSHKWHTCDVLCDFGSCECTMLISQNLNGS